jgi:hypothetical protein
MRSRDAMNIRRFVSDEKESLVKAHHSKPAI